jgi:putative hemolysin
MLILAAILFVIGMVFSAFCSGTETAFYRASRVRLVMSVMEGDRIGKLLAWFTNRPAFFVATILIGNNIANYIVSFSVTLAMVALIDQGRGGLWELVATILIAPVVFVFGESFPKSLGLLAPNRCLRLVAIPLVVISTILAPLAAMLWGISRLLENLLGQSPERLQMTLARKEIEQVLDEGQHAGILHPSQRQISQNFFLVAARPIRQICVPVARITGIKSDTTRAAAVRFAQRHRLANIPVVDGHQKFVGYFHLIDLLVQGEADNSLPAPKPLRSLTADEAFGEAILWMQTNRENLVQVVNKQSQVIGLLSIDDLTGQLLKGPLESLRR